MKVIIKVFYKLVLMAITRYVQNMLNDRFAIYLQYLKKKMRKNMTFCMQRNIQFSYKSRLSILAGMTRHAGSIQNNKFTKSLQYLKKSGRWSWFFVQINMKFLPFFTSWFYHIWWALQVVSKLIKITSIMQYLNIFAISQGRGKCWSCFFTCW